MSETVLPAKTADTCDLPDGTVVWVQTLNKLLKKEAAEAADMQSALHVLKFRASGEFGPAIAAQFEDMTAENQAAYIAQTEYVVGRIFEEANEKFPMAPEPVRENENDEAYMSAVAAWQEKLKEIDTQRQAFLDARYVEQLDAAKSLTDSERKERCHQAFRERKYREEFTERFLTEMLYRAVRCADNHSQRFYASAEAVRELDDASRSLLADAYFALDAVTPSQIPT